MASLSIGFAQADITPAGAVGLGGYIARTAPSVGVHLPLRASCVACQAGGGTRPLLLYSLEVLMIPSEWPAQVAERLGLATEQVMLCATHTHSGPSIPGIPGGEVPHEWLRRLPEQLVRLGQAALKALQPATLHLGAAVPGGIGSTRHAGVQGEFPSLTVLRFLDVKGKHLGVMLHYPCHPTVLGPGNLLLSPDFTGVASRELERALGGWAIHLNGASADISTRLTRQDSSVAEAERLGHLLAQAGRVLLQDLRPVPIHDLHAWTQAAQFDLQPPPDRPALEQQLQQARQQLAKVQSPQQRRQLEVQMDGLNWALTRTATPETSVRATLTFWQLGTVVLCGIPGEVFSGQGQRLASEFPHLNVLLLGLCNGYLGYFAPPAAHQAGMYEALASPLTGAATLQLQRELRRGLTQTIQQEDQP